MDHRIHQLHYPLYTPVKQPNLNPKPKSNFKEALKNAGEIKNSKHARHRLKERNIQIDAGQWQEIGKKVDEARRKGITDSLVLTEAALLVSAKNHTVVTAMYKAEAEDRIFTNINGTILMKQ